MLEHLAITVAAHEAGSVERTHLVDRLAGKRSGGDVTAEDDQVRLEFLKLGEHRLQSREVAVNVVESCD
jgi:hypothetical protein